MWELIDQYVYLYIMLSTFYIYLNNKSQYVAGILLVGLLFLSSSFFLNIILGPALFILSIITIVMILVERHEELMKLEYKKASFYEIVWSLIGMILIVITLSHLFNISFTKFINNLKIYDTWVLGYVIILVAKFIQEKILKSNLKITEDQEVVVIDHTNEAKHNYIEANQYAIANDKGDTMNNELSKAEQLAKANNKSSELSSKRRMNKDDNNTFNVLLIALVILLAGFSYFMINRNQLKYDVSAHVLPIYDHSVYNPEISVLAANEKYEEDGDYSKLYNHYTKLGYTKEEIDAIFTDITSDTLERINKIDLTYEVSMSNVKYGDNVKITATYDQKKAKKQKVKIINPVIELTIDDINEVASSSNITSTMLKELDPEVKALLNDNDITADSYVINNAYLNENIDNASRDLIIEYKLTNGKLDALIGEHDVDTIYVMTDVHLEDGKLVHSERFDLERGNIKEIDEYTKLSL